MHIREIILDTETTGLDPSTGDRIVEIGCVEVINSISTGQTFHAYLDPERDIPEEAFRVHGLSRDFLAGKPKFAEIAQSLVEFLADAHLVIHNAEFDMKFINAELGRCGVAPITMDRVVDTLAIARRKHPGASNSLDALCARYRIDNSRRTKAWSAARRRDTGGSLCRADGREAEDARTRHNDRQDRGDSES